jgi:hypothetical protein
MIPALAALIAPVGCMTHAQQSSDTSAIRRSVQAAADVQGQPFAVRFVVVDQPAGRAVRAAARVWDSLLGDPHAEVQIAEGLHALGLVDSPLPTDVAPRELEELLAAFDPNENTVVIPAPVLDLCDKAMAVLPPRPRVHDPDGRRQVLLQAPSGCLAISHAIGHAMAFAALTGSGAGGRFPSRRTGDGALVIEAILEGEAQLVEATATLGLRSAFLPMTPLTPSTTDFATLLAAAARAEGAEALRDVGRRGGSASIARLMAHPPLATVTLLAPPGPGPLPPDAPHLPHVASADLLAARGYTPSLDETVGALAIRTLLRSAGDATADEVAAEWVGDRLIVLGSPAAGTGGGGDAGLWLTCWRSPDAAGAFRSALLALTEARGARLLVAQRGAVVAVMANVPDDLSPTIQTDLLMAPYRPYAFLAP